MASKENPSVPTHILSSLPMARIEVFFQVVILSLAVIAVFGLAGYFLDSYFGTYPKIFVGSVLGSFPFTQFFLFKRARYLGRKHLDKSKTSVHL